MFLSWPAKHPWRSHEPEKAPRGHSSSGAGRSCHGTAKSLNGPLAQGSKELPCVLLYLGGHKCGLLDDFCLFFQPVQAIRQPWGEHSISMATLCKVGIQHFHYNVLHSDVF